MLSNTYIKIKHVKTRVKILEIDGETQFLLHKEAGGLVNFWRKGGL